MHHVFYEVLAACKESVILFLQQEDAEKALKANHMNIESAVGEGDVQYIVMI